MLEYNSPPISIYKDKNVEIPSFISTSENNLDKTTVDSFGNEWERFGDFSDDEIINIGNEYFDIVNNKHINDSSVVLDVGCGSGRWSKYISSKVAFVEAIDPSSAVLTASRLTSSLPNVRVTQASVDNIPFEENSFDFVFSLGVLHHIPDTKKGIKSCVEKLKPNGYFLVYLYYNLDNRSTMFRFIFKLVNFLRFFISKFPQKIKVIVCDVIASVVYFPLAKISYILKRCLNNGLYEKIPLSYYHDKSFYIMRNDALDRFGTPLEKRFSKIEIEKMMKDAGLADIVFSPNAPFWHAIGRKI